MLGWALKKGLHGAIGHRDGSGRQEDATQFEAPDTPAPVFAARAIKNAIWGQPTTTEEPPPETKLNKTEPVESASDSITTAKAVPTDTRSPTKLNSILLTPGTSTSRRKRVSFGGDVKAGNNVNASPLATSSARDGQPRKKTTLQQALEDSRPTKSKAPKLQVEQPEEHDTGDEWESEDGEVLCCNHDITVDLNEPHSESGKYWKAEWSRYREEAKSDIEQLVKYKANAKSFAAKKDMEASQLSQKLKEEQAKVAEMDTKIMEMAEKLAATRPYGTKRGKMEKDFDKQTSLLAEYRERVKDLETRLKETRGESGLNQPKQQRINTSPRTEQSILEVSRELRKARSELRQMDQLRDEAKRLRSNLATARERVAELETQMSSQKAAESARTEKFEKQLRELKELLGQKDTDIKNLKEDYESLKRDAKSRTTEAMQVLQDKNTKIEELEKKLQDVQTAGASNPTKCLGTGVAQHNKITEDRDSDFELLSKPSKYDRARPALRRRRAASAEDVTLDLTQRFLLRDEGDAPVNSRREMAYTNGFVANWATDILTVELPGQEKKTRQKEAEKAVESTYNPPSRGAARGEEQRRLHDNNRAVSDVLSNRVNESTRRRPRRGQVSAANTNMDLSTGYNRGAIPSLAEDITEKEANFREELHDRLEKLADQQEHMSGATIPASLGSEVPAIDLVQDQFSRLGGPRTDRTALGNTSRCGLPAGRLAAARARLEQKKLARRKASETGLQKENVKP
ncbi:hypothetical protein NUW58_g9774 [Xylaria curta]|uniref:Uncharacterized protein n=1 Tax=Xylaria curta TaxID=42375 RepID=A0ACC1MT65_9PEZI|nr:hypothetical protein NUW58_g9774 [Xylaria curta]